MATPISTQDPFFTSLEENSLTSRSTSILNSKTNSSSKQKDTAEFVCEDFKRVCGEVRRNHPEKPLQTQMNAKPIDRKKRKYPRLQFIVKPRIPFETFK